MPPDGGEKAMSKAVLIAVTCAGFGSLVICAWVAALAG